MTQIDEFDRVLGDWLHDGPNRAPDRPIELAADHARAHPRRRDPLGFLRPDPMARRASGFGSRPVLVLATVGLLVAAVAAVGIGGQREPSVVIPPSASPSVSSPPLAPLVIDLQVPAGQPQTVRVVDASGRLAGARTGTPTGETGASFPFESIEVSNIDATTLQLGWTGYPCATDHTLTIEADGLTMTMLRPDCVGDTDTVALDRILVLQFVEPIDAADVAISMVR